MNACSRLARLIGFAGLAVAAASCGSEPVSEEPIVRPVRTQQVFSTGAARTRSFSGTAQSGMESRLSFKIGGNVRRLEVAVGDQVGRGDLIASLDPADYQLEVQNYEAALSRAEAESRQADASYERVRQLYENRNASRADLDAARAAAEASTAAVESAQKSLALGQSRLSYARLVAPVDGAISSVNVEVNENVNAGQVVAVLTSGSELEVVATVPEVLIGYVREGDAVTVVFDALPDRTFDAIVTEVAVSASGATFPVTASLSGDAAGVRPGMAADVSFRFDSAGGSSRIVIPAYAVLEDRSGRFVFVAEPSDLGFGIVHRREVEVGELGPDGLEIVSGVEDGDRLVTAGVTKLQDGLRVRLPLGDPE